MRRLTTTAVQSLALVAAGCAGGDTTGGSAGESVAASDSATSDPGAAPEQGDGIAVDVSNFAFDPEEIEVEVGTTITWTNQDQFAHTVTSGEPGSATDTFDGELGEVASNENAGTTFTTTLDEAGTFAYFCRLHPNMIGTVVVG